MVSKIQNFVRDNVDARPITAVLILWAMGEYIKPYSRIQSFLKGRMGNNGSNGGAY